MEKKLVSIIIPFYNAEKHVDNCIDCLKQQTYPFFEAVFVDDGSTDGSCQKICRSCDERIKLFKQEKKGVSSARNLGIAKATGHYIAFWDVDDVVDDTYIEKFVNAFTQNEIDVAICNYAELYTGNKIVKKTLPWEDVCIKQDIIQNELLPRMIAPLKNEKNILGTACRIFTRKDFLIKYNIFFHTEVCFAEDLLFTIKLYNHASTIYVLKDCLYFYKKRKGSTTNKYREGSYERDLLFHKIFIQLLKEENLYEKNRIRYEKNKINMYSVEISNFVRSKKKEIIKDGLKKISDDFRKESINYKNCPLQKHIKIACFMMKHRLYFLLYLIYSLKERLRLNDFSE